ncbi:MAG: hypothetical protein KBD53_04300 [Candidatus Omnitrophica bacterium]|nr:hypothetical protein [Candidatus Omnitrophota bacterium]
MKNFKWILFLGLFLVGCETTTPLHIPDKETRIRYLQVNPVEDEYIHEAIRDGEVVPGMTKEQVLSTWGEPVIRGIGRWEYTGMRNIYILFKDGIVTEVRFYT